MRDWSTFEVVSIKIRSTRSGRAIPHSKKSATDIERSGESFLASDQADDSAGNAADRRVVATDLIDQLIEALREPLAIEPDPINMGITLEWFQENIGKLIDDAAEGYSDSGKRRFADRVGHYEIYCGQILNDFQYDSTDDYAGIYVRVEGRSGQCEELQTSSKHYFMLPWQLGRRQTNTFNSHISRAVAALLPDEFLNKDRLLNGRSGFCRLHDEYDDLLDVPEHRVLGHSRRICSLFFTPDGKSLVSGGMDNVVKVWDASGWTERHCFDTPRVGVNLSLDLAPNGTTLAFNDASVIKLVDIQTGHIIRELKGHRWVVRRLMFLLDGTQLASEDSDGVRLWDVRTGEELVLVLEPWKRFSGLSSVESWKRSTPAIASSDCHAQVSVSKTGFGAEAVEILDRTTRNTLKRLVTKGIENIALPPDGRCLVTGHFDGHLGVWQLPAR